MSEQSKKPKRGSSPRHVRVATLHLMMASQQPEIGRCEK